VAYPALPIYRQSNPVRKSGREIERAVSGAARGRDFYAADKHTFRLEHRALNATDFGTLAAFYNSNRNLSFSFTWAPTGATHTVLFDADGFQYKVSDVYACFDATVTLIEV
jgi:uncharacterized protein RhaS with RHS repeats